MKEAEKQKNQHHHQHHHHHRHHLNHFCIVRVRDKYIRVCNNSYIPRNTHAEFINGKKVTCAVSLLFSRETTFSRHQCRLNEINAMRENSVTSKSMYHRCCCSITNVYLRTI